MACLKEQVYHCVVMFYNQAKVIIEIQHSSNFILFFDETHFLDKCLKLIEVQKLIYNHSLP